MKFWYREEICGIRKRFLDFNKFYDNPYPRDFMGISHGTVWLGIFLKNFFLFLRKSMAKGFRLRCEKKTGEHTFL